MNPYEAPPHLPPPRHQRRISSIWAWWQMLGCIAGCLVNAIAATQAGSHAFFIECNACLFFVLACCISIDQYRRARP